MAYTPRYTNLTQVFLRSTEHFANSPLFGTRGPDGWHWLSYSQFRTLVDQARAGLNALGVARGDRVAVISSNRVEWAVCAYACYTRGAIYVPMYEAQLDRDWQHILHDSGAKLCFVGSAAIEQRVAGLRSGLPALEHIVNFDAAAYRDLLARGAAQPVELTTPDERDIAVLIYTSGTTGVPKGVELMHFSLAANVGALLEIVPVYQTDRTLAFLPWAHVFGGCVELNAVFTLGAAIAICDHTDRLLGYLPEVQPTLLFAVPRIWNRIYDGVQKQMRARPKPIQLLFNAGLRARSKSKRGQALSLSERLALVAADKLIFSKVVARFGGRLRMAISGAAALSPDVAEFIDNLGIQVYEGYGMTEGSGAITTNYPGAHRIGSVGKAIPGVELKIDRHAPGAQGDEGEILVYGTCVMAGYHNLPEATRDAITEDGGLRTGDLGRIEGDGLVVITGRVKELYKLQNGKYVAPAPLEEKLQLSPYIAQCLVYGSDQVYNVALIVPDMAALKAWASAQGVASEGRALLDDRRTRALIQKEIDAYAREFKGYETIRNFVLTDEEMTLANDMLTPTLKLKRRNVLGKYEGQLKALYADAAA